MRPKEPSDAPPQKPLSRSCAHDLRHHAQAGQGGAGLSPCPGGPCGGRGVCLSSSSKVSLLGRHINTLVGLENQRILQTVFQYPFRTLDRSTADCGCNWCNTALL